MKNKKALALIISVTLIVSMTLPGTLAVSEDQAAALDGHTLAEEESAAPTSEEPACTCGTETGVHTEACAQYTAPPRGENHGSSGSAAPHCAQQDRSGS